MGDSGANCVHLHLGLNYPNDNPLQYLQHSSYNYTFQFSEPPSTFTQAEAYLKAIRVKIKSGVDGGTSGLDLNRVTIYLDSDPKEWFDYGGRVGESKIYTVRASNGSYDAHYIAPIINGEDDFVVGGLNLYDLAPGEHTVSVIAQTVNNGQFNSDPYKFTILGGPKIVSTSPETGSFNISADTPITITFDTEMDMASVEAAFIFMPDVSKIFTWSADKKTVKITITAPLAANTDYTITIADTAKDKNGNQLDGDKDGQAGGNYTFKFSTKAASINTSLSPVIPDGSTYWVNEGIKTVTVQLLDDTTKQPISSETSPVLKLTLPGGTAQDVALSASGTSWTGTINIPKGKDGKATFSGANTQISGISSFMIDTTPPKIESAAVSSTSCPCPYGPLAFKFNTSDTGSGIASTTTVGLGLSANGCYAPGSYQYGASSVTDKAGNSTSMTGNISVIQNKCTNPDDNYSATIMNIPGATLPSINIAGKKVAVLGNGYAYSAQRFLSDKVVIESTIIDPDFSPDIYTEYPLLIIPTGGLSGLIQSEMFKAKLAKYVENGGVILAFSQNQGYEFEALPGGKVTGYGYTNDQQCFTNAAYIDGWHQIFSGQGKANLDLNIDGFMTGIPEEGQTFLKRVANGQSALAVYPYGNGYVIATTLYTDWGYSVAQYTTQEINLVRDIVAWAKMPTELPEIKPGGTVSLSVPVMNNASTDAVSVKIVVRDPAKNLIAEFTNPTNIPAGEYAELPFSYTASATATLGIWWVDYTLIDSNGGVIQPEYEGARFAVATRPQNAAQQAALSFSVLSDSENYPVGSNAVFTIMAFNSGDTERTITAKYYGQSRTLTVPSKGSASIVYTKAITYVNTRGAWLTAYFYDENDQPLGNTSKRYWSYYLSAGVAVQTDKSIYYMGETLLMNISLKNNNPSEWDSNIRISITDPKNIKVFEDNKIVHFLPNETVPMNVNFTIPTTSNKGYYTVRIEALYGTRLVAAATTRVELPESQISITSNLPSVFNTGDNLVSFVLNNIGKIGISAGSLDVSLKDPEGVTVYSGSLPFTLAVGESKTLNIPILLQVLNFGDYTLTYTQSDETRTGQPTTKIISNVASIALSLDKASYKVRETANLALDLMNAGMFNLENASVTVSAPDAGFTDTRIVNIEQGQALPLKYAIPIPETIAARQHNVNVTVTLPSGSSLSQSTKLIVPESALALEMTSPVFLKAGDSVTFTLTNNGGVDTSFVTEELAITDSKRTIINNVNLTGNIRVGETKTYSIPLSTQTAMGYVTLDAVIKDDKTGIRVPLSKVIYAAGVNAILSSQTDKSIYMSSEAVSALNTVINKDHDIIDGALDIKIIQNHVPNSTPSIEYKHFLPQKGWPVKTPMGVAVGPDGSVYVTDYYYSRIQKYDAAGNFITKWGSYGSGNDQFSTLGDIVVAPDGSVYVKDSMYIKKFDSNGKFVAKFGGYGSGDGLFYNVGRLAVAPDGSVYATDIDKNIIQKFDANGNFITKFGGYGNSNGKFMYPGGIAIAPDGSIYISDGAEWTYYFRIQKFDANGVFIAKWGSSGSGNGQFYYPRGIAVDSNNFVYVADYNHRIQKFDSSGGFISKWGTSGSENGQFYYPEDLTVAPGGDIYVADTANSRVQRFNNSGNFISIFGDYGSGDGEFNSPSGIAVAADGSFFVADTQNHRIQKLNSSGVFVTKWGVEGHADGRFEYPWGIAVNFDGSIYVADSNNNRIQKFDSNGNFITKWGSVWQSPGSGDGQLSSPLGITTAPDGSLFVADTYNHRIQKFDVNGNFIAKWGSQCSIDSNWDGIPDQPCDGQFYYPYGIAVALDGSVYVVEKGNHRIQKFDSAGNFITKWGNKGSGDGQFKSPRGVSVDSAGSVYVIDTDNHRVQKFDANGNFIQKWGSYGSNNGQLYYPNGINITSDGFIYIADTYNHRIQKFDTSGNFIDKSGNYDWGNSNIYGPESLSVTFDNSIYLVDSTAHRVQKFDVNGNLILKWGSKGNGDGEFLNPRKIATSLDGSVYIADTGNHRIQKFDASGNLISKWGSQGSSDGQFYSPQGIAVSPDGSVYIADSSNHRIQQFDSNGNFVKKWGGLGYNNGQFNTPVDIAIALDGSIYVAESNRIQKFDSNGNFITKWGGTCATDTNWDGIPDIACDGKFYYLTGVAVDANGYVYATENYNNRFQIFDDNGNFIAKFGSKGSNVGQFYYPQDIALTHGGIVFVADKNNGRVQKMAVTFKNKEGIETFYSATTPITQSANTTQDYTTSIGTLNATGKLYLQATLKNILGQTVATSEYPFYIVSGNTVLSFNTDKKIYKPGETVTIVGEVKNLVDVTASALSLQLLANGQNIYNDTFDVPTGGSHPFTFATSAGAEGKVTLMGTVIQNGSTLVEISDQYEVANPQVSMTVTAPDVVGRNPFDLNVEVKNTGKVDVSGQWSVVRGQGNAIDNQQITIKAGETKALQYSQQITANTTYAFTLSGDVSQTVTKTVAYGEKAQITVASGQGSVAGAYPEGKVGIPVTITNTGQVDEELEVAYQLAGAYRDTPVQNQQTKTYYLPKAGSVTDMLYYDLTKGSYQLSAVSAQPLAIAQVAFTVAKENDVIMTVASGQGSVAGLIPMTVNLTNNGWNTIEGSVQLSVVSPSTDSTGSPQAGSGRSVVWSGEQGITPPNPLLPQEGESYSFNIDTAAIAPGTYNLEAVLYNNAGQQLAIHVSQLTVRGPTFEATQLPPYTTFTAGQEGAFTFKVKNTGNQEGEMSFNLKLMDVLDQTRTEWLKPGEEKELSFAFQLPEDLEEKDYFGEYNLNATPLTSPLAKGGTRGVGLGGVVKFHVAGVNIAVNATLDKQNYNTGETARLSISMENLSYELPASCGFVPDPNCQPTTCGLVQDPNCSPVSQCKPVPNPSCGPWGGPMGAPGSCQSCICDPRFDRSCIEKCSQIISCEQTSCGLVSDPNCQPVQCGLVPDPSCKPASPPIGLFARVNYAGYESQQPVALDGSKTLIFDVPLTQITGEKLFYGIYHESGRSIHLNSLYVYKAGDAINITTDKQVYNPGETVTVTVGANGGSPVSGQMTLTGPGNYSETFVFSGSATKSITLPTVMTAGTYNISGQLSMAGGQLFTANHPIDVNGIQVKVKEATLDKAKYAATDTLNLSLNIESNKDMSATLKTWVVDPSGKYTAAGEQTVNLSSTEPLLTTGHWPLTTASMGIHRLVYGIYVGGQPQGTAPTLLLSSGSEAFDVGDAVLLGMTTDKVDYSTITEPVNISFSLYGSTTAIIDIYVDGQSVKTETIALSGFATKTVSLEPAAFIPGSHSIKAVLTSGGLTSVKETSIVYGSNLPDLTAVAGGQGSVVGKGNSVQIKATVMNMGKTASGVTNVTFYDGVGAIHELPLQALAPGESTTVTFDWNVMGKAGRHTISAEADASKMVAEFNESNNIATVDVEVPELVLNVTTTSNAYEANQDVGIAETITNLTAGNIYSDAVLTATIKDSAGSTITTLTNSIPAIAPGEASYANSWNTGSNRPGNYIVTAVVSGQGPGGSVTATATFDILSTVSAFGDMALSSNEVIQGFPMDISYTLTNNGNVEIGQAEVKVEVENKTTHTTATLATSTLDYLAVLASENGSIAVEKVDVEPGEYSLVLVLTAGGKTINISSKDITVKPPLKVTKGISILPRVLVWTHSSENNSPQSPLNLRGEARGTNELIAIDALTKLGAYYRIVHTESEFMEYMRSGYYNTYALLDTGKPTTDGLTSELVEKSYGGDTLILTGSSSMDDIKISDVTGTKFIGYLPDGVRTATIGMPFYEQLVNITTAGKAQKATMTSATAYASGAIADIYPSLIVNSYGKGKGVLVAFDLGKSSESANDITTYSALFGRIIGNTAPIETRLIPEGVAPVEITVESIGSAFDLKVVEKTDSRMAILDAGLNGSINAINNTITWSTHIDSNQTVRYLYLSGMSQFRGSYATEAEVYYQNKGEYRLYNNYPLDIELAEGAAELQNNILNAINLLSVTKDKQGIRDGIVKSYMTLISRSSVTRKDIDKDIQDVLKITEDLIKLSAETREIRSGLDDLLRILQRRWAVTK